jgi:hypothetical protein
MIDFVKISAQAEAALFSKAIPRRVLDCMTWKILLEKFGEMNVISKYYGDGVGNPDLYANEMTESTLKDFYGNAADQWAIKDSFYADTLNPLYRYTLGVLEQKFNYDLKSKVKTQFTARISSKKWSFPDHFDGIENFMFCLIGTREVDLRFKDIKIHYSLKAGDILYIPPFWYHHFWANNDEPCYVINFAMKTAGDASSFGEAYPKRMQEIETGI